MSITRCVVVYLASSIALSAGNVLQPGTPVLDRPTLTTLGVQFPITGDDNVNATVSVRYRVSGASAWQNALPLFRVHPETVYNYSVQPQFAGSIFDVHPGATYDIELHAVDPDGLDQIFSLTGTTRSVPGDPVSPAVKNVVDGPSLQGALNSAAPGDVITLANGVYSGTFQLYQTGTSDNPIVIRGANQDGVILDGGNCTGCNVIEIYGGGYVHIENLTIQNAERAIRFQSSGETANVVRRLHTLNTMMGIGGRENQYDFYIADNVLEGRLVWPQVYTDDGAAHADDTGISVLGFGHVVAHNQISGFGDAMRTSDQDGARANDFYGNEILYTYDNGIELDGSEGNTRCFRNRFTNTFSPLSVQPIHGGPSYLFRNVVVNMKDEQMKFHALGSPYQEPSGVLAYNNTFVAAGTGELRLWTPATSHYFAIENNLFIAPGDTAGQQVVDWEGPIDHGVFDYNGYFPNGLMRFNNPANGGYFLAWGGLLDVQNYSLEQHGMLLNAPPFASGLTAPDTYVNQLSPADVTPAVGSPVIDAGLVLANINDNFTGAGPDLGAQEAGCPAPIYGPRPVGVNESNEIVGCSSSAQGTLNPPAPSAP